MDKSIKILQPQELTMNVANLVMRKALKTFELSINIKRFTTDANGTVVDDAVVPVAQQKDYPFHLFGEFDRQGGYALADSVAREQGDTKLFGVYVSGLNTPLFFFSPLNTINSRIKKGDLVFIYVDDLDAPTWFHFVIISATQGGFASLSSITNITQIDADNKWGAFSFYGFKFAWQHDSQLRTPIYIIETNYRGAFQANPINVEAYRFIEQKPGIKSLRIPVQMLLNQYNGLSGFIAWENPMLTLSFKMYY